MTAENLVERMDHYTHLDPALTESPGRKDFVVQLAEAVVQSMLDAPARKWEPLAEALGAGFDAREALMWSRDRSVMRALTERRWDGTLPEVPGDFFFAGEFAHSAKKLLTHRRTRSARRGRPG